MTAPLSAELARTLQARLEFYRELGIYDFYQRAGSSSVPAEPPAAANQGTSEQFVTADELNTVGGGAEIPLATRKQVPSADRLAALAEIRAVIGDCTRCALSQGRNKIVFGDGNPHARLMFVGEGPGADEDAQGLPFVGRAGQLLNNMIAAMGLKREEVYIANIVKCRPPGNRVPEPGEAHTCMQFLESQIEVVRPEVMVALGSTAATYLLGAKAALSALRGRPHNCRGTKLFITYHPAFLLRDPRQKAEAWKDLQLVMAELRLKSPARAPQA